MSNYNIRYNKPDRMQNDADAIEDVRQYASKPDYDPKTGVAKITFIEAELLKARWEDDWATVEMADVQAQRSIEHFGGNSRWSYNRGKPYYRAGAAR